MIQVSVAELYGGWQEGDPGYGLGGWQGIQATVEEMKVPGASRLTMKKENIKHRYNDCFYKYCFIASSFFGVKILSGKT